MRKTITPNTDKAITSTNYTERCYTALSMKREVKPGVLIEVLVVTIQFVDLFFMGVPFHAERIL